MIIQERGQRLSFLILFALVLGGMGLLVSPLWRYLVWGSIVGVMLVPVRRWLQDRVNTRPGIVSGLVYVFFVLAVITPFILLLATSGDQAGNVAESAESIEIGQLGLSNEGPLGSAAEQSEFVQRTVQWLLKESLMRSLE